MLVIYCIAILSNQAASLFGAAEILEWDGKAGSYAIYEAEGNYALPITENRNRGSKY